MSDSEDGSSDHSPARSRTKRSENGKEDDRSVSKERNASHSPAPSKSKRKYSRSRSRSRSRGRHSRRSRSRSSKHHKRYSHSYSRSRSYSPGGRSHSRSPMSNRRRHNGNRENPEPNRCLGVFGLSTYTTERELYDIFSKFGPLESVTVVIDVKTNTSRGFAFVYFEYYEDARAAKEQCSGMEIDGRKIRVDYSITQRAHTPTPGIYMGKPTYSKRYDKYDRYDRRDRDWDRDYYGGGGGYRGRYRSPSPYYSRSRRRHRSRSRSYSPYY